MLKDKEYFIDGFIIAISNEYLIKKIITFEMYFGNLYLGTEW